MSSKARELSKFSFDIHVNEGAGTLGIGTTADVGDRLYVEGGTQITGVATVHSNLHCKDDVGIGTDNPVSGKLHVLDGNIRISGTSENLLKIRHDTAGSDSNISQTDNGSLRYRYGGDERLRITSAGLVGIGTDTPTTALHVFGGTSNDQVVTIESTSSSGIGAPDLSLFTNDPAIQNGQTIGVLRFDSFDAAGTKTEYARVATTIVDTDATNKKASVVIQARKNNTTVNTVATFEGGTGDMRLTSESGAGVILAAPNGTLYKITVTNAGAVNVAAA
jgi:hypothetical protein